MKKLGYSSLGCVITLTLFSCSNLAPLNRGSGGEAGEAGRTSKGSGGTSNGGGNAGASNSQNTAAGSEARGGSPGTTSASGGATTTGSAMATGGTTNTGGTSYTGGAANLGGTSQGGTGTTATTTQVTCPSSGGPVMVKLPDGYCIDSTEVTRGHYATWLATVSAATVNAQDATTCGWNTSFDPTSDPSCDPNVFTDNRPDQPQVCADWCDAVAYCKGVGKRLCGSISGGPISATDFTDPQKSQWYTACSSGGKNVYPYGNTYQPEYCYTLVSARNTTTSGAVGTFTRCQPAVPYAGIFDLAGSVDEWLDACASSATDANCLRVGGSRGTWYGATDEAVENYTKCARPDLVYPRTLHTNSVGFRCCFP
jgi:formylglycine-generating enzyme required for sulfatase activity